MWNLMVQALLVQYYCSAGEVQKGYSHYSQGSSSSTTECLLRFQDHCPSTHTFSSDIGYILRSFSFPKTYNYVEKKINKQNSSISASTRSSKAWFPADLSKVQVKNSWKSPTVKQTMILLKEKGTYEKSRWKQELSKKFNNSLSRIIRNSENTQVGTCK